MKNRKLIQLAAMVAFASTALLAGCSETPRKLDGKVVKDSEGNYYIVEHGLGDTLFLTPVPEEVEKF